MSSRCTHSTRGCVRLLKSIGRRWYCTRTKSPKRWDCPRRRWALGGVLRALYVAVLQERLTLDVLCMVGTPGVAGVARRRRRCACWPSPVHGQVREVLVLAAPTLTTDSTHHGVLPATPSLPTTEATNLGAGLASLETVGPSRCAKCVRAVACQPTCSVPLTPVWTAGRRPRWAS